MSLSRAATPNLTLVDNIKDPPTEIVRHAASRLVRRLPSIVRYDDLYSAGLTALVMCFASSCGSGGTG